MQSVLRYQSMTETGSRLVCHSMSGWEILRWMHSGSGLETATVFDSPSESGFHSRTATESQFQTHSASG
jgi:hypothetical protein